MKLRNLSILITIIFLAACEQVDVNKASNARYDPTSPDDVKILNSAPEQSSYEKLGSFKVSGFTKKESRKMFYALQEKAAALGANAVIVTGEGLEFPPFSSETDDSQKTQWATGVAIRFKTTAPSATTSPATK